MLIIYLQMLDDPADRIKLEQIYSQYKNLMRRVALNILHSEQDAEDAVHNAFLNIVKNIGQVSDVDSAKTRSYVVIIAERKALDLYRQRRRRAEEALPEDAEGTHSVDLGSGLADCINRLPDRDRQAIILRYAHNYHIGEIANIFEISYAAAAKLVERAKDKLEKLCREEGIL